MNSDVRNIFDDCTHWFRRPALRFWPYVVVVPPASDVRVAARQASSGCPTIPYRLGAPRGGPRPCPTTDWNQGCPQVMKFTSTQSVAPTAKTLAKTFVGLSPRTRPTGPGPKTTSTTNPPS